MTENFIKTKILSHSSNKASKWIFTTVLLFNLAVSLPTSENKLKNTLMACSADLRILTSLSVHPRIPTKNIFMIFTCHVGFRSFLINTLEMSFIHHKKFTTRMRWTRKSNFVVYGRRPLKDAFVEISFELERHNKRPKIMISLFGLRGDVTVRKAIRFSTFQIGSH